MRYMQAKFYFKAYCFQDIGFQDKLLVFKQLIISVLAFFLTFLSRLLIRNEYSIGGFCDKKSHATKVIESSTH